MNLAEAFVTQDNVQYTAGRLLLRSDQPERALLYLAPRDPAERRADRVPALARRGAGPHRASRSVDRDVAGHPREAPRRTRAQYWLAEMRARAAVKRGHAVPPRREVARHAAGSASGLSGTCSEGRPRHGRRGRSPQGRVYGVLPNRSPIGQTRPPGAALRACLLRVIARTACRPPRRGRSRRSRLGRTGRCA